MTTAFRIAKRKYSSTLLSGQGGLVVGGRWHHKGVRIVYCAQSLSLAGLEYFVHLGAHDRHVSLLSAEIHIPDGLIEDYPVAKLPANWRNTPSPASTADIGAAWIHGGRSAVLRVPSAITPGEHNLLISPSHRDAARIAVGTRLKYALDPRMWK